LIGAAIAHSGRHIADCVVMNLSAYLSCQKHGQLLKDWGIPSAILIISSAAFIFIHSFGIKIGIYLIWFIVLSIVSWRYYFDEQMKTILVKTLKINS